MNYKKYNDYELIYMVRENDDGSIDLLINKYSPIIKSLVSKYYEKFKNFGYDYDDFYQEASYAFYRAVSTYDESKDCLFYTYVVLCINRCLLSFCKKISSINKNGIMSEYISLDDVQVVDENGYIESILNSTEIESILKRTIFDLPVEYSVVLELKINGFKYNEISHLLDLPCSTVEFRCRKAMVMLRKRIQIFCK